MKSITYLKKRFGIVPQTIRNYVKQGKLKAIKTANNRYFFEEEEINRFEREFILNEQNSNSQLSKKAASASLKNESWCFYLRSSEGNKVLLQNQEINLRNKIKNGEITDVAVTQADRLSRFGNTYLIELFNAYNVKLHVLFDDKSLNYGFKRDLQHELMKDFMSLIASFSGRFYRLRSFENKVKLLDEAKNKLIDESEGEAK